MLLRALLVAASDDDTQPLIEALRRGGYEPEWKRVEDEAALRAALITHDWDVVFCDYSMPKLDARRTLRILRETGDTLTAIVVSGQVTDMMMPIMGGTATVRVLLRLNPDVRIIVASGSNSLTNESELAAAGIKHFLPKPYTAETLLRSLHDLLHGSS
ncbi:MAG TPA: response regulator [Chthoniobacteraceae bacterium]|jgi:CheY-like chemotaxis protein